jgi:two-component system, chemotaxis family, chemotaxis protein CheY
VVLIGELTAPVEAGPSMAVVLSAALLAEEARPSTWYSLPLQPRLCAMSPLLAPHPNESTREAAHDDSPGSQTGSHPIEELSKSQPQSQGPILVIDDDPDILSTVVAILELEGYQVLKATNGAEGLEAIDKISPSLVLLDMRMPVLNGWDFARIMKERGLAIPIVVMTAAHDAGRWAKEVGAVQTLPKPFGITDLLDVVEFVIGKGSEHDD